MFNQNNVNMNKYTYQIIICTLIIDFIYSIINLHFESLYSFDFDAYMEQIQQIQQFKLNYETIKGDTGTAKHQLIWLKTNN
jgi:hypothetical protein